jgi:hypothetical protein
LDEGVDSFLHHVLWSYVMSRTICLAAAWLIFSAALGMAQEPAAAKPGPEHEQLQKMAGTWDVTMKMAQAPAPMKGVSTAKMEMGGLWLVSDFKMDDPAFPFQGKGLDGYDQHKKKFVGIWVDSMSSAPMFMEGNLDAASKTMTMTGEAAHQGKPEKFKTVTKMTDDDHYTFQMFMVGADGKDTLAFTIEYVRKK